MVDLHGDVGGVLVFLGAASIRVANPVCVEHSGCGLQPPVEGRSEKVMRFGGLGGDEGWGAHLKTTCTALTPGCSSLEEEGV